MYPISHARRMGFKDIGALKGSQEIGTFSVFLVVVVVIFKRDTNCLRQLSAFLSSNYDIFGQCHM